jgi:hypothetical protein
MQIIPLFGDIRFCPCLNRLRLKQSKTQAIWFRRQRSGIDGIIHNGNKSVFTRKKNMKIIMKILRTTDAAFNGPPGAVRLRACITGTGQ